MENKKIIRKEADAKSASVSKIVQASVNTEAIWGDYSMEQNFVKLNPSKRMRRGERMEGDWRPRRRGICRDLL